MPNSLVVLAASAVYGFIGLLNATLGGSSKGTRDMLLVVNNFALLGYFATNIIFFEIFYK